MLTQLQMDKDQVHPQGRISRVNCQTWEQAEGQVQVQPRILISERIGVRLNIQINIGICEQVEQALQQESP